MADSDPKPSEDEPAQPPRYIRWDDIDKDNTAGLGRSCLIVVLVIVGICLLAFGTCVIWLSHSLG